LAQPTRGRIGNVAGVPNPSQKSPQQVQCPSSGGKKSAAVMLFLPAKTLKISGRLDSVNSNTITRNPPRNVDRRGQKKWGAISGFCLILSLREIGVVSASLKKKSDEAMQWPPGWNGQQPDPAQGRGRIKLNQFHWQCQDEARPESREKL